MLTPQEIAEAFTKWLNEFRLACIHHEPPVTNIQLIYLLSLPLKELVGEENEWSPMGKIMKHRIEQMGHSVDISICEWISFMLSTPGEAVMVSTYLAGRAAEENLDEKIDIAFVNKVFEKGWFDKRTLNEFWDKQKLPDGRNLLDNIFVYEVTH